MFVCDVAAAFIFTVMIVAVAGFFFFFFATVSTDVAVYSRIHLPTSFPLWVALSLSLSLNILAPACRWKTRQTKKRGARHTSFLLKYGVHALLFARLAGWKLEQSTRHLFAVQPARVRLRDRWISVAASLSIDV